MDEIVKGYIKSYKFRNESNSYTIAKIETDDGNDLTIVGYFPILREELLYEFMGEMIEHPTFGLQFKVTQFKALEDKTEGGLIRYLSSDDFTGIGPKTAEKIIKLLGTDAIEKIIADESVLNKILTPIKAHRLREELLYHKATNDIFVKLYEFNLSDAVVAKIYDKYKLQAVDKLLEDPYRLMYEVEGFGFIRSAEIANKMGLSNEDIRSIKAAIYYTLKQQDNTEGNLYLLKDEITEKVFKLLQINMDLNEAFNQLVNEGKLVIEEDKYFLYENYKYEIDVAKSIYDLSEALDLKLDDNLLNLYLSQIEIEKRIEYTNKQKEAILSAIKNPLTIITGGPGTGKTTLIDGLIELYAKLNNINLKQPIARTKIALMAPTGRAAKRMQELLKLEARTIHSHIGFDFSKNPMTFQPEILQQDLVIIDEASMIDISIANLLFKSIKLGAQVIIVGDEDQLPSVGPGYVLGDLIASNVIPVVRLKEIHRQAKDSYIVNLAMKLNHQELTPDDLVTKKDVIFRAGTLDQVKDLIINQIGGAIKKGYDLLNDIQVLIPTYKGDLGIDEINHQIQKNFNPNYNDIHHLKLGNKVYYKKDRVIQLRNDHDRNVMNGDIGIVEDVIYDDQNKKQLLINFDNGNLLYGEKDLEDINLAYVVSIHKSQGSEYKIVFLPLVRSYEFMLKKELVYTAITRAKNYLFILGDPNLLLRASNKLYMRRQTMLSVRLNSILEDDDLLEEVDPTFHLSPYDFM